MSSDGCLSASSFANMLREAEAERRRVEHV